MISKLKLRLSGLLKTRLITKDFSTRTFFTHLLVCLAFVLVPFFSAPKEPQSSAFSFGSLEINGLISSLLLIIFFYANYLYYLPELYHKKRYLQWLAVVVVSFLIIFFVPRLLADKIISLYGLEKNIFPTELQFDLPGWRKINYQAEDTIIKFLFALALSFLIKTNKLWIESREEKQKAELALLRSQVNPHFLFNTLNGIYSLSLEESKKTPESIYKLSELMRYVIREIDKDNVLLKDEIAFLQSYIDLQRMRLGQTVIINFDTEAANPNTKISPLLLISFVENAFKHGINTTRISEIEIILKSAGNKLYFSVKNQIGKNSEKISFQKGHENVKRRLELIYPHKHKLKITNTENNYQIELNINNLQ